VIDLASAPNNDYLVVDGNILSGPTNLDAGNAYVGGTGGSFVQFPGHGHLDLTGSSPIVNGSTVGVANQATYFKSYSSQLSQLTGNGTVVNNFGTITFTGTDPSLDVFNVDISVLGGNNTININDPSSATVVINVTGTSGTTTGASINVNGGGANGDSTTADSKKVLFNFFQATSLTFGGSVIGSVLAPYATVTGLSRQLDGQLIAGNYTGSTEFHDLLFNGTNLPNPQTSTSNPTPEPGTLVMFAIGLSLVAMTRLKAKARSN
jgi:choice-of-anchor A domain-containing protein